MEKFARCEKCGAMVKVLIDCTCDNCGIKCCNETMKEITYILQIQGEKEQNFTKRYLI